MKILFDLQDFLSSMPLGELTSNKVLSPYGKIHPTLIVEQVEDVKVLRVANCINNEAGLDISLSSFEGIRSGDRFTLVGRFGQVLTLHGGRMALFSTRDRTSELVSHEPYNNLFTLSCLITDSLNYGMYLCTAKSSGSFSAIDFFVDGVMIVRQGC